MYLSEIIISGIFVALALVLVRYLLRRDIGEREPTSALWMAFVFGVLGLCISAFLEHLWIATPVAVQSLQGSLSPLELAGVSLKTSLVEELAKSLPLLAYIYHRRYFNEHTDGVIYFALAGLGFGLPENMLYTLQYGAGTGLTRLAMTPWFHAALTAIVGYVVIRVKLDGWHRRSIAETLAAIIALHGLYNFGLLSGIGLLVVGSLGITFALAAGLLVLAVRAGRLDGVKKRRVGRRNRVV